MGATASRDIKPEELFEFRRLSNRPENIEIPELPENRVPTDRKFLIVFIICIALLFPFLIYTLVCSDIRRLYYATDDCGNFCGEINEKVSGISCSGADYSDAPYAQFNHRINTFNYTYDHRRCVSNCPDGYQKTSRLCFPSSDYLSDRDDIDVNDDYLDESLSYLMRSWWKVLIVVLITTGLCLGTFLLMRYATGMFVWTILIFSIAVLVVLSCGLWYVYNTGIQDSKNRSVALFMAIFVTLLTLGAIILIIVLFKRIKLVILLYKETMKAVFAMPGLLLIPAGIAWFQLIVVCLSVTTTVYMSTAGNLEKLTEYLYGYVESPISTFTIIFNWIITLWIVQFINGCQYMIIAGAVSSWYFAKNKRYLEAPITRSISILVKFHLGTVAFGSLIITIITVIRMILQSLTKNEKAKVLVDFCMSCLEDIVKFLSKQAYIQTAINGQPFYKSGKRAAKLLLTNAVDLVAVNSVGDFFLGMTGLILIIISSGITYFMFMDSIYGILPGMFTFVFIILIVAFMFAVLETTVDTLFICFCEDKEINDGLSKPYYMSRELMQFVDNAKKFNPANRADQN